VGGVLVVRALDDLELREEHGGAELVASLGEKRHVKVGQRHDEAHTELLHELREPRDVLGRRDRRREHAVVGVVEGRRERVQVDGNGLGPRIPERGHDVDALARAGEEDGRHAADLRLSTLRSSPCTCR
jgi:hypothetical protein